MSKWKRGLLEKYGRKPRNNIEVDIPEKGRQNVERFTYLMAGSSNESLFSTEDRKYLVLFNFPRMVLKISINFFVNLVINFVVRKGFLGGDFLPSQFTSPTDFDITSD
jgi:hypothetical protein